jgi:hypothetical protein
LNNRCSLTLLILVVVAFPVWSDQYIPTLKTDWVYLANTGGSNPVCFSDEMSAAQAQIAVQNCSNTFQNWTTPWPNTVDQNGVYTKLCAPLPNIDPTWGHRDKAVLVS